MAFFKVQKAKPPKEKNTYEEELDKEKDKSNQEESEFWGEKDTTI